MSALGAFFASFLGKCLSVLAGIALCLGTLAWIGHVRKENVRLTAEVVVLHRDLDLLRANAALVMKIEARAADRETTLRKTTEETIERLRHVPIPKLTPTCEKQCSRTWDHVRCAFGVCPPPAATAAGAGHALPRGTKPARVQ